MKFLRLRALLTLVLLTASKRQRWQQTADRIDEALDAIQASNRRIQAMENGGWPKVRVV